MIRAFELFTRNNGRYYYRLVAETGHIILSSDGYRYKKECLNAINEVKARMMNAGEGDIHIMHTKNVSWKFIITNITKDIVGYSMDFHSEKQCKKWISLMQKYLPVATIIQST